MENISKYLDDKRFIQWVFTPNDELETWWKTFENGHPKEKRNIQLARKILFKLKTTNKNLNEKDKILIFSRILKHIEEKGKSHKSIRFISSMLKYAAVAILFFAIGAALFYQHDNFSPQFASQNLVEAGIDNEAILIRPNGDNILLKEKKSIIEYTASGQVKVNNSLLNPAQQAKKGVPELNNLIIPYGKTSEIILPDGSKVNLNAGSRLVYPEFFNENSREVFLVGEAFFEVKKNENQPFIVQTSELRIKVLGTKFNISAYSSDKIIETVLTEGKVRLMQNNSGLFDETTEMKPNQLAVFDKTSKETKIMNVNTDDYTLWKDGMFKFEGTDLSRVIKKLERFYNIRFQYGDPMLGCVKISGKLELDENCEEIINRISVAASVTITKKREQLYIVNK